MQPIFRDIKYKKVEKMKNRYEVENNIIKDIDNSYTSVEFYLTDDRLEVLNENGIPQYKIVGSTHVLRSQSEIDADYLLIYIEKRLLDLRELLYTRWVDSSKTGAANQSQYKIIKSNISNATSLSQVDNEYNNFKIFMDLS